jgi:hypothetical protein
MATLVPLTMHQSNDEVIDVVITPVVPTDDLSLVTSLRFYLKPDVCTSDTDAAVTVLTSAVPAQITITAQTAAQIDATVYVPSASLLDPYSRVWRIDAYSGTTHRTALYGPATVIDL